MTEEIKLTPGELGEELWGSMPIYMKETNIAWLRELFRILEMDGVWVWPETDRVFQKVDKYHFIEIEDDEE